MKNGTAYIQTVYVALRETAQRKVEWYSVHTNGVALRKMAQRNIEWYSVHTNGVELREMAHMLQQQQFYN